jgi:hypothetical protein
LFARVSLSLAERIVLVVVAGVAAACHATFMLLAIGLAIAAIVAWLFIRRRLRPGASFIAIPVFIALLGTSTVASIHYLASGKPYLSQTGDVFLLARFVQDGLVGNYLDRVCPSPAYTLCDYRDKLPESANDFLWSYDNLLDKMGGWVKAEDEARRIVRGSLAAFPLAHLRAAAHDFYRQLLSFRSGDGTWSQTDASAVIIGQYFPHEFPAYLTALQQHDRFDFDRINLLHVPAAAIGMIATLFAGMLAWRRRDLPGIGLATTILLGIMGNAAICGVLSNPGDRYGSRMVWIAVFGAIVLFLRQRSLARHSWAA